MFLTFGTIVRRALLAGLVMGVLLGGYVLVVVEPVVEEAIALEESMAAAHPGDEADDGHSHGDDEALFTRDEQVAGGALASFLYALVAALVFGTVFSAIRHRLPGGSDLARASWLALVGFATIALLPAIKYPANPPAVGDPDTVGERTIQYLALIVVAVVVAVALSRLSSVLRRRLDDPTRIVAVTVASVVAYGLVLLVLPATPDEIDPAVPAGLVWDFRIRSIGGLALLWLGLGVGLGWLLESPATPNAPEAAPQPVTAGR